MLEFLGRGTFGQVVKCWAQAQAAGSHPRRPEAGEHHVGRSRPAALPRQGDRFRISLARQQGHLQYLPAVALLPRL